ncbi:MAG: electron transport complex subunit RsxG [Methylococcales bacterium]
MSPVLESVFRSAAFLGLFAVVGTSLIDWTHHQTQKRIAENERTALLQRFHELIPAAWYDNDILSDKRVIGDKGFPESPSSITVYRIRKYQTNVAVVIATQAPDGYNGTIKLLVAIRENGELVGVRVVAHRETPGLGDGIEESRSNWVRQFAGRSLDRPYENGWAVKRDGGVFDQFTGATITPRAIVNAVRRTLIYYRNYKTELFE